MFNNITVIGSGLMGSAIAAHFANIGCKVNLLDIVDSKHENKNHLSDNAIKKLLKINPSPLTLKSNINLINAGNIDEDLNIINDCDWIIEAVIENLEVKKNLYKKIDKIMKKDLIISSNTSTIPIKLLTQGLSENFKKNFLITHFFNPPRYLKLLEIVQSDFLNKDIFKKIATFCDINLGKTVIKTKDTPGFIGNRIGIFWIERAAIEAINFNLTVEEADLIIMKIFNVPKTGIFGLIDVVGLDLIPAVVNSLLKNIPKDDYYKNGGCYAPRRITRVNAGGAISRHTWGIAIDINTKSTYHPRVIEIFNEWGFAWGGTWTSPDPMHFELRDY